jgi:hypothetical protein
MLEFDLYAIWPKMQSAGIEKLTTLIEFYGESKNEYSILQNYCEIYGAASKHRQRLRWIKESPESSSWKHQNDSWYRVNGPWSPNLSWYPLLASSATSVEANHNLPALRNV